MPSSHTPEPLQQKPPVTSTEHGRESRAAAQSRKKKRVRHFTADDRAAHRAFEKERREAFRERLLALADMLPSLADKNPQALSKHTVVEEGIAHITAENARLDKALKHMRALVQERDEVLAELNQWRSQAGIAPRQPSDMGAYSQQQLNPGKSSQIRRSPAPNAAGIDSPFKTALADGDLAVMPEAIPSIPSNASRASIGGNDLPEPFDSGGSSLPLPLIDQPHRAPGLVGPLEESMIGTGLQQPVQDNLFNNAVCLTADAFDVAFVSEALQPSSNYGPVMYNSADDLNLPVELQSYAANFLT